MQYFAPDKILLHRGDPQIRDNYHGSSVVTLILILIFMIGQDLGAIDVCVVVSVLLTRNIFIVMLS